LFVVVHEATADFETATELADRVLTDQVGWLDVTMLDGQRTWLGQEPDGARLSWKSIPARARELGIRVRGHFDGQPGLADAKAAWRAIAYVLRLFEQTEAILLIRDMDDQPVRRGGLEQARALYEKLLPIIIGAAIVERECWVLSGFTPETEEENKTLAGLRQELGFDPCLQPQELTAGKDDQAKRSAKRVLALLTDGSWQRQEKCWRETPLSALVERGEENGLRDYLDEVKQKLVPLITGARGGSKP
jgi:hypothetical protein